MVADSVLGSLPTNWGDKGRPVSRRKAAATPAPSQKARGSATTNEFAAASKTIAANESAAADKSAAASNATAGKTIAASNSAASGKNLRMKAARVACGMSQSDLAEAVGVTRQTIGLIEAGGYNPTLNLCCSICKTLGVTLNDLFWEE